MNLIFNILIYTVNYRKQKPCLRSHDRITFADLLIFGVLSIFFDFESPDKEWNISCNGQ